MSTINECIELNSTPECLNLNLIELFTLGVE